MCVLTDGISVVLMSDFTKRNIVYVSEQIEGSKSWFPLSITSRRGEGSIRCICEIWRMGLTRLVSEGCHKVLFIHQKTYLKLPSILVPLGGDLTGGGARLCTNTEHEVY